MKKTAWIILFIGVFIFIVILFTQNEKTNITNKICPVMTAEEIDPNLYYDFQGQRVYLCCKRCVKKFSENPQKYMKNLKLDTNQQVEISFAKNYLLF